MPSLSPFLFVLVTQVLTLHIKISQLNGITALGVHFKLSQFTDDTAVLLKNRLEIPEIMTYIEELTNVSGLRMNLDKSVLFPFKECSFIQIENIPVKQKLTYLGVIICKSEKLRSQLSFEPIIEKTRNKCNMLFMKDISIFGRVLLWKAEGISRSVYTSIVRSASQCY